MGAANFDQPSYGVVSSPQPALSVGNFKGPGVDCSGNVAVYGHSLGVTGDAGGDVQNPAPSIGVSGEALLSPNGIGVQGVGWGVGVVGQQLTLQFDILNTGIKAPPDPDAVERHVGVLGISDSGTGVKGSSGTGYGVAGHGGNVGVYAHNPRGNDVYLATASLAGDFRGEVSIQNKLTVEDDVHIDGHLTAIGGVSGPGVVGLSDTPSQAGVFGESTSAVGVAGKSTATDNGAGVYGECPSGAGVFGRSQMLGVYGVTDNSADKAIAVFGEAKGTVLNYQFNKQLVGVRGEGPTFGVHGIGGVGIYGQMLPGGSLAGLFDGDVAVNGNFIVAVGSKNAAVPHPDGSHRLLYCLESPESWFEDFGTGKLVRGRATVKLEPNFAALVDTKRYHVFLTAYGDSKGLYVTRATRRGFEVREQQGGRTTVPFSFRVVAHRKDVQSQRLKKVKLPRPGWGRAVPSVPAPSIAPSPKRSDKAKPQRSTVRRQNRAKG